MVSQIFCSSASTSFGPACSLALSPLQVQPNNSPQGNPDLDIKYTSYTAGNSQALAYQSP